MEQAGAGRRKEWLEQTGMKSPGQTRQELKSRRKTEQSRNAKGCILTGRGGSGHCRDEDTEAGQAQAPLTFSARNAGGACSRGVRGSIQCVCVGGSPPGETG